MKRHLSRQSSNRYDPSLSCTHSNTCNHSRQTLVMGKSVLQRRPCTWSPELMSLLQHVFSFFTALQTRTKNRSMQGSCTCTVRVAWAIVSGDGGGDCTVWVSTKRSGNGFLYQKGTNRTVQFWSLAQDLPYQPTKPPLAWFWRFWPTSRALHPDLPISPISTICPGSAPPLE